jgi:hypothetical protein
VWCEYDWLDLDYDKALRVIWKDFSNIIKHQRRFFFLNRQSPSDADEEIVTSDGSLSPERFLPELGSLVEELSLVKTWPQGSSFFRARKITPPQKYATALELGPPPEDKCTQANRMSPPGIPMTYGALEQETALKEIEAPTASVGKFSFQRDVQICDLTALPPTPGLFSGKPRRETLATAFLHTFSREISKPITRDDESFHIDYVPSQIMTEFLRDYDFAGVKIDGICFASSVHPDGKNLVLFATQENFLDMDGTAALPDSEGEKWIRLVDVQHIEPKRNTFSLSYYLARSLKRWQQLRQYLS